MRILGGCLPFIAALLMACGGDNDEGPTPAPTALTTAGATSTGDTAGAPFDPCSVLTAEGAGQALGKPVEEGVRIDDPTLVPPSYRCDWIEIGDTSSAAELVSVEAVPGDQAALDDYYSQLSDAPEVPDLGVRAHYDDLFGLEVMMDGYILAVTVIADYEPEELRQRTVDLGRIIVDRLD